MSDRDTTIRMDEDQLPSPSGARIDHGRFVPGALVGSRYRIVAMLGKGGMGEVYRADDLLLGQPVALKFLPQRIGGNANALARLLGEVRIARQISHPNVCRVYDVGEVDGEHFISMEYVQGEDLHSLLQRIGRFGPDKGVQIARQICAGLAAAHDRGVLHRDLKPANVMIDERGMARITDFGLAVLADSAEAQKREGTPAYMAPEQLEGEEITTRSDIYSLGLVLYELFTGRMLFEAKTLNELLELRRTSTAKSIRLTADVDPIIERVIQRCLDDNPERRPKSASAVAAALPGGNPLDAAMAAGETPSPEVVAAAGEHRGIEPAYALAGLGAVLALLAIALFVKSRIEIVSNSGVREPPAVLAVHARDLLARLGYTETPRDTAWRYLANIHRRVEYWYRESPNDLVPNAFFRSGYVSNPGFITDSKPPLETPGEALVRFETDGRLQSLRVIPPRYGAPPPKPADWTPILDAAHLDRASLVPVAPSAALVPFDQRAAWRTGDTIVEAAAMGGRIVSFDLRDVHDPTTPPRYPSRSFLIVWMAGFVGLIVFFAHRNLRAARADVRGATRTALFVAISNMLTFLLGAHHVASQSEALVLLTGLAWTSFICLVLFGGYIAVEPTMRRRWPHSMISWSRLLDGQFRDPIVGRDVLAGCIGGLVLFLVEPGVPLMMAALRGTTPALQASTNIEILNGGTLVLSELLSVWGRSIVDATANVIFLILFYMLTRRRWAGALLFFVLHALLAFSPRMDKLTHLVIEIIVVACFVYLPSRFGYLSLVVACGVNAILDVTPVLLPAVSWHTQITAAGVAFIVALAGYGFIVSLAGRPLFDAELIEP